MQETRPTDCQTSGETVRQRASLLNRSTGIIRIAEKVIYMDSNYLKDILSDVSKGVCSVNEAAEMLITLPYDDMGFAKLDSHRNMRTGASEVVFGQGKTPEQVALIMQKMSETNTNLLCTRATPEMFSAVKEKVISAEYDPVARLITVVGMPPETIDKTVAVVSAGTSDMPVAEEAAATAAFYGCPVIRIYDAGVAGIHRLFDKLDVIRSAGVVIAVAGMEGALASVIGGLVDIPVIAVPTSVGYGSGLGGVSALLAMLNSCSPGVAVMNIDNGFGAGYMAALINKR